MMSRSLFAAGIAGLGLFVAACADGPMSPDATRTAARTAARTAPFATVVAQPVPYTGNLQCTDLGFLDGAKYDLPSGVTSGGHTLTVPGLGNITFTFESPTLLEWQSDFPIDGVMMKGGPNGILYPVDGATSGGGEVTPINPNNDKRYDISHLEFCWYGRFSPSVDGAASYTRDYDWSIAKTANAPASVTKGALLTVSYTVTMSRAFIDGDFAIAGTVTVANTGYGAAGTIDGVSVDVGGVLAEVDCPVTFPTTLANNATLACSYDAELPNADDRLVTATVAASGLWRPTSTSMLVSFGEPTTVIDETATVSDTRVPAGLGEISAPQTFNYSLTFGPYTACVPVTIDNTASFITNDNAETGSSSASVTVDVTGCSTDWEDLGTGFAYGSGAATFTSIDGGIKRWGWTLDFGAPGSRTYDVYVGAGQNDRSKGTLVGTVTITYTGTTVTASYALLPNYVLAEQHLYAGSGPLPTVQQGRRTSTTVAPGQYSVNVSGGDIWVIAHSVIGYVQP